MQDLLNTIRTFTELPEEQGAKLLSLTKERTLAKGDFYVRKGQIPKTFAFVRKGLFRYHYVNESGHELTKGFFAEGSFLVAYSAIRENRGSFFYIQALEDSEILTVSYEKWLNLQKEHRCWDTFLISLLEKGYITKETREREFLLLDAEARYRIFMEKFPGLDQRIKQHMIASYLGITSVALSRVRKKMGLIP